MRKPATRPPHRVSPKSDKQRRRERAQVEDDFDTAEVPSDEIRAMRPFSELVAKHAKKSPA